MPCCLLLLSHAAAHARADSRQGCVAAPQSCHCVKMPSKSSSLNKRNLHWHSIRHPPQDALDSRQHLRQRLDCRVELADNEREQRDVTHLLPSISRFWPPYSGIMTWSPSFTLGGMMSPVCDLLPGPTAMTLPSLTCTEQVIALGTCHRMRGKTRHPPVTVRHPHGGDNSMLIAGIVVLAGASWLFEEQLVSRRKPLDKRAWHAP